MPRRPTAGLPVARHPVRVVTRRTGLSADLLRVWERRHGVVKPVRSASGRRFYSDADIERLALLYRATLAGRGIGAIAKLTTRQLLALARDDAGAESAAVAGATRSTPAADEYSDECVRAIERLDAVALEAALRRAVVALPAAVLLDDLVVPLLDRIGGLWRDGTLRPVHGHVATAVVRRVLDRITETATSPLASHGVVVGAPAGEVHELGAMLVAAAAAAEGWRVTFVGIGLAAEDLVEAAMKTGARVLALSLVYPPNDRGVRHELRRLGAVLPSGTTLVVGGPAASTYGVTLDQIGATRLADLAALRALLRTIRVGDRRRPGGARAPRPATGTNSRRARGRPR